MTHQGGDINDDMHKKRLFTMINYCEQVHQCRHAFMAEV